MKTLRKFFGGLNMTWPKVIFMAVITAVMTALLNEIPSLKDTSFQDIAISFECWILFALVIITNCKKWWEASLKTFVFFLISQPLIYLIEVPFEPLGFGIFGYYKRWAIITVLTLPGAAAAFLVKRKDTLSLAVLSAATAFLGFMSVRYAKSAAFAFPNHLLSAIFCLVLALLLVFILLDKKSLRIIGVAVIVLAMAVTFALSAKNITETIELGEGTWSSSTDDESIIDIKITDDGKAEISAKSDGICVVTFENENGETVCYDITVSGGGLWIGEAY